MNERWFLDNFLTIARESYRERYFVDQVSLTCRSPDDYDGPIRLSADLLEIDAFGRAHLWMFASVFSPEAVSGGAIGRLFAYDRAFRMAAPGVVRGRVEAAARRRRYDTDHPQFRHAMDRLRPAFDSWNLVVCGGRGCELAGRDDNLMFRLYAPLSDMIGDIRDINTWHFYQTSTGFDLRNLWDMAAMGRLSAGERLALCAGRRLPMPAPEDDFDIAIKRDLHLKRRKGFHVEGYEAYFSVPRQAAAG